MLEADKAFFSERVKYDVLDILYKPYLYELSIGKPDINLELKKGSWYEIKITKERKKDKNEDVGGHLFAIAADKSIEWGYEGTIHGFAANGELLKHYIDVFHAEYLGMLHQYQFFIDEKQARELLEVYHYEWNEI